MSEEYKHIDLEPIFKAVNELLGNPTIVDKCASRGLLNNLRQKIRPDIGGILSIAKSSSRSPEEVIATLANMIANDDLESIPDGIVDLSKISYIRENLPTYNTINHNEPHRKGEGSENLYADARSLDPFEA